MKKIRMTAAAVTAAVILSGSCSGTAEQSKYETQLFAMDTLVTVTAYGDNGSDAASAASERIRGLEELFSVTKPESDIGRINTSDGQPVTVSDDTAYVISGALETAGSTDGALDITIYPVLKAWGFTTSEYRVPPDDEIAELLKNVGYDKVTLSGNTVTVPAGTMLDLGSCGKGYASDEMIRVIRDKGVTSAIVNLGGNVQTLGTKPDGSDWTVGIADPFSPNELLGTVKVHNKAVVTSGGYQRYFWDGEFNWYIHILDPKTGKQPTGSAVSVTVIGDSGFECDRLSTALFVMGPDAAAEYYRTHKGFDMIIVSEEGNIYATRGIADSFTNSITNETEIIDE